MAESLAHTPVLTHGGSITSCSERTPKYDGVIEAPDPIRIVHIIYLKVALELVARGVAESRYRDMENPV